MSSPLDSPAGRRRWVRKVFNGRDDGQCADAHASHPAKPGLKASGAHVKQQREHANGGGAPLKQEESDTNQNSQVKQERKGNGVAMDKPIKSNYEYAFNTKENTSIHTTFYALHPNVKEHVSMSASPMGKYSKRDNKTSDDSRQESRQEESRQDTMERSHNLKGEDAIERAQYFEDIVKKDAPFAQDMSARVYSKGILLKVFTDLFPNGVADAANVIDGEKRVEMRGRRDLPRSMRRANLVVLDKKKVTSSDNLAAAATSSVPVPDDKTTPAHQDTKTAPRAGNAAAHTVHHHNFHQHIDGKGEAAPWQWPAEWAKFASLNGEAGGRVAKSRMKPPKPVRLELAAAVETESRNESQLPLTPPGHWPYAFPPQVMAAMPMLHPTLHQALHGHSAPPSMVFGPPHSTPHGFPPHGPPTSMAGVNHSPLHTLGLSTPPMTAPWIPSAIPPLLPRPWDRRVPDQRELPVQVPPLSRPWDKKNLSNAGARASTKDLAVDYTTVMLRHIPNKYTRQMLLDKLDQAGFSGLYDFVYLPCDFANSCNVGYAFINFRNRVATQRFIETFHHVETKECLGGFNSTKVCEVMPARVQGKEANLFNIQHSPVALEHLKDNPEWKPLVFGPSSADENLKFLKKRASNRNFRTEEGDKMKLPVEWKPLSSGTGTSHFSGEDFFARDYSTVMSSLDLFAKEYEGIPTSPSAPAIYSRDEQRGAVNFTTVMLRNIPNKYTRQMLCERLNDHFHKEFDFLYLPIDFVNKCNVGYAFINFRTTESTARFIQMFHHVECRVCLKGFNSIKICEVTAARLQGKDANIEHLKHSSVMEQIQSRPEWQPLVFDDYGNAIDQIFKLLKRKSSKQHITATSVLSAPAPPPTGPPVAISLDDTPAPSDAHKPIPQDAPFEFSNASLRAEAPAFIPTAAEQLPPPSRLAPAHLQSDFLRAEAPAFIPTLSRTSASTTQSIPSFGTSASLGIPSPQRTPLFSTSPSAYGNAPLPLSRYPPVSCPVKKPAQQAPPSTASENGTIFRPHVVGTPIGGPSKGSSAVDVTMKGRSSGDAQGALHKFKIPEDAPERRTSADDASGSAQKDKCPSDEIFVHDKTNDDRGEPEARHDQVVTETKTHSAEKKAPAQHNDEEKTHVPDVNVPSTSSAVGENEKMNVSGADRKTVDAAELTAVVEEGGAADRDNDKRVETDEGTEKKKVEDAKPSWTMTISNIFKMGMFRGVEQFQKRKTDGDDGPPT